MQIKTISETAGEAYGWFESASRADGASFIRMKDGAPKWVSDLVWAAHDNGEYLPDDYRYRWAMEACETISEADDPEDVASEFSDQAVSVYTGARIAWLGSNLNRPGYCDEAAGEYGADAPGIVELIGLGMYYEASEVYALVLNFLRDLAGVES